VLETNEWPGTYIPIIPVYGDEVNFEGTRYFRSLIRDAKDANQMFNLRVATNGELQVVLCGTSNVLASNWNTGAWKAASINCANGVVTACIGSGARSAALTIGAAALEAVNILIFGRNATTPANMYTGFGNPVVFIDKSLNVANDTERPYLSGLRWILSERDYGCPAKRKGLSSLALHSDSGAVRKLLGAVLGGGDTVITWAMPPLWHWVKWAVMVIMLQSPSS